MTDDLTLREMQLQVDQWVKTYAVGYWEPLAMLARLVEEVGEMARLLNHLYGPKQKRLDEPAQELALELGDLLYTITCIANLHEIDLQEAFTAVIRKLDARDREPEREAEGQNRRDSPERRSRAEAHTAEQDDEKELEEREYAGEQDGKARRHLRCFRLGLG